MAAIFLVLAVADAALLANVVLANTSTTSVTVFDQSITGYTQGEVLLLAAGLGLLFALFVGIAWSSSSAHGVPSVGSCARRDARWRAGSPSSSARTHASTRNWRRCGAPARWWGPMEHPARRRSHPGNPGAPHPRPARRVDRIYQPQEREVIADAR